MQLYFICKDVYEGVRDDAYVELYGDMHMTVHAYPDISADVCSC